MGSTHHHKLDAFWKDVLPRLAKARFGAVRLAGIEVGWVAAYDFDFSEPSSPQRPPTRVHIGSGDGVPPMDRKP
jgi:hypothetical protein